MTFAEMREYIEGRVARVARFSFVARASADGQSDAVENHATDPTDPSSQVPVRRMGPFGLRSVPPVGTDALVLHVNGGSSNGVLIAAESEKYGPSDLKTGESCQYCKATNAFVKLDEDGNLTLNASTLKNIYIVDGATQPVPLGTALKAWLEGHIHSSGVGPTGPAVTTGAAVVPIPTTGVTSVFSEIAKVG